jgi:RNA polymerase sigma factor (sigma-70 family)
MAVQSIELLQRYLRRLCAEAVPPDDAVLLHRFVTANDREAFELLIARHGPMVLGTARRLVDSTHDAEDVFQAVFLSLARLAKTIRQGNTLPAWLHKTTSRIAAKVRKNRVFGSREPPPEPCEKIDPEAQLVWQEVRQALDEELQRLPERLRSPLLLCCLSGLTRDEAAKQLGWSLGTLKRRLEEGRKALRIRLARRDIASVGLALTVLTPKALQAAVSKSLLDSSLSLISSTGAVVPATVSALVLSSASPVKGLAMKSILALLAAIAVGVGIYAGTGQADPPKKAEGQKAEVKPAKVEQQEKAGRGDEPEKPMSPSRFLKGPYKFRSLSFSRDGRSLATVTMDADAALDDIREKNAVRLWDVQTGSVKRTLAEDQIKDRYYCTYAGVGLSPDGNTVAVPAGGKFDGEHRFSGLVLWDAETGKIRHKLKHDLEVRALGFSPDGKLVASGTGVGGAERDMDTVLLWDVKTGQLLRTLKTRDLEGVKVVFAPDSKLLAAVLDPVLDHSEGSAEVVLWDAVEGKASRTLPDSEGIEIIAFTPDGKTLLGAARTKLLAWDVATGTTIQKSELKTTEARPALAFSPDGKTLAVSDKHDVALYDVKTAKRTKTLKGGEAFIWPLVFSPDGNTLAGGSSDQTIYLWDFDGEARLKK